MGCVWLQVLAVWRYDKREVNGAPVVYFGTELRAAPPGTIEHQVYIIINKYLYEYIYIIIRQPHLLRSLDFRVWSGNKACRGVAVLLG
jgi:hypothetical protein